jgi:uncharacterized delta-60 repeat protein
MSTIETILSNINSGYGSVTKYITNQFNFSDDPNYWTINSPDYDYLGYADVVFIQSNGKIVVAGRSGLYDDSIGGIADNYTIIKRFNVDGTEDESFTSPKFHGDYDGYIRDIKQQSSGKLIVVGHFTEIDGVTYNRIVRLNTDGSVDETFDAGLGLNGVALVCKVLSDNTVIVGGSFTGYDENVVGRIVKLGVDGAINSTFSTNASRGNNVFAIEVDANNDVYLGGNFTKRIIRVNADGTTDTGFDVGTGFNGRVSSIKIDSNSKIVVGGWFDQYKGTNCNTGIVRLETNGNLDTSFETDGDGLYGWYGDVDNQSVQSIAIQGNGKIVAGGWFYGYNGELQGRIIRFNSDGSKDTTFNTGTGFSDRVQSVAIDGSGNIFCAGFFYNYNGKNCTSQFNYMNSKIAGGCVKLNSTGALQGSPLKSDVNGVGIDEGGDSNDDMYDSGCYFNTNINNPYGDINNSDSIPFTHSPFMISDASDGIEYSWYDTEIDRFNYSKMPKDGEVVAGDAYFGNNSKYFTNMYPGLLVLGATNIDIEEFSITGSIGQDGDGDANTGSVDLIVNNKIYSLFYKTSYDNSDTEVSINQLIIVSGSTEGITQEFNDLTDNCDQVLTGLTGREELYVLTFSRTDQTATSEEDLTSIAIAFLSLFALEVIKSCSSQFCATSSFKCLVGTTNSCTCSNWKYYYPNCTRANIVSGLCSGKSGAYVPAIVVCNQRLF